MAKLKVVIGVPTYKRYKGLSRLLKSLSQQICDFEFDIIIADNEGKDGVGHQVVKAVKDSYPLAIKVIPVTERGISHVRNALMHEAFQALNADVIAMVDDDEVVDENWINELIKAYLKSGAQVIGGAIYPEFKTAPPEWTKESKLYFRTIHAEDYVTLIQAAGNILLHKSIYNGKDALYFDENFGLTGGEDKEFFIRLKNKGIKFYYTPEAKSFEYYGPERVSEKWALERAYRIGCNDTRILKYHSSSIFLGLKILVTSLLGLLVYTTLIPFFYTNKPKQFKYRLKLSRQIGKLQGLNNYKLEGYK